MTVNRRLVSESTNCGLVPGSVNGVLNILKNIIAVLAAITPLWAVLHPDFIPVAVSVSPMSVRYLLQTSNDKEDTK